MGVTEIWSRERLAENLRGTRLDEPTELEADAVPPQLRQLIPYAEWWGLPGEEASRNAFIDKAPAEAVRNLVDVERAYDSGLTAWLAGPEADATQPTRAYLLFAAMVMAADYAKLRV